MPRKDKTTQDPRTYVELSDGKPLMAAVPKTYLRLLASPDLAGSITTLAKGLGVGRSTLSDWISGRKEMPNEQVLSAAILLGVSPLCVLDRAGEYAHEAPDAMEGRAALLEDLAAIRELEAGQDVPRYEELVALKGGRAGAAQALRDNLQHVKGDYRDLAALMEDAASCYRTTTRPDYLLQQMHQAFVSHGWHPQD